MKGCRVRVIMGKVSHILFVLVLAALLLFGAQRAALADEVAIGASGGVLMDVETGRVLASKNAHTRLPMASTTKIMTALLAIENSDISAIVKVPQQAYGVEGSSMYLNAGEKISMEDLIYGLMLTSGNDAAITIANYIGGSVENFADMMNKRAVELGCTNTNFVTPNGLHDENHYTSAYDLALISACAMKNETFSKIVGTQYYTTKTGDVTRSLKNKNKILWNYEGGNGIKTGFTKAAGRCLAFSAEQGGHTLVGVVLNAPDMWNAADTMLDYGFSEYTWERLISESEVITNISVTSGMKNSLEIVAKEDIIIPLRKNEGKDAVKLKIICPNVIEAPVREGQVVGKIEAHIDGRVICSVPLIADDTIMQKEYPYYLWKILQEYIA